MDVEENLVQECRGVGSGDQWVYWRSRIERQRGLSETRHLFLAFCGRFDKTERGLANQTVLSYE